MPRATEGNARRSGHGYAAVPSRSDTPANALANDRLSTSNEAEQAAASTEQQEDEATRLCAMEDGEMTENEVESDDEQARQAVLSNAASRLSEVPLGPTENDTLESKDSHVRAEEEAPGELVTDEEDDLPPGFIHVRVLDLKGKFFRCAGQLEWSVARFKQVVTEKTGVPAASQRLIYRGRVLDDAHPLQEYKLEDGHTIHLFVRSAGNAEEEAEHAEDGQGASNGARRLDDPSVTIVHITSDTVTSAVFPSDTARRVDPLMLDSPLGNCARRVKLWSSFLLIIYTMKVMGQFALLANDSQMRPDAGSKTAEGTGTGEERYYDRYNYPEYYDQDAMVGVAELVIHAFGVYVGCVGFKAAHDTDIRPIRFYCRGIVWLAILTLAEQVYVTLQISQSDFPESRVEYAYGPAVPTKEDIVSANIFQTVMLLIMWIVAIHHSYSHQAEVARYNESFARAAINAPAAAQLPVVV